MSKVVVIPSLFGLLLMGASLSQAANQANNQDSDGDGVFDRYEQMLSTDPHDPKSKPKDLDKDGIPDEYDLDIDGDGVNNWQDPFPTNPQEFADGDGDGVGDSKDKDSDGDGFSNLEEKKAGTNPYSKRSFPDNQGPVVDLVKLPKVVNNRIIQIQGMALDTAISHQLRPFDSFYRLHDNNFAVVLPHTTSIEADVLAKQVLSEMPSSSNPSTVPFGFASLNVADTVDSLMTTAKEHLLEGHTHA